MVVGFSQVETDKLAYYSRPSHLPSLAICPPLLFSCCFFRIHKWAGGRLKGWAKEKQPYGADRNPSFPFASSAIVRRCINIRLAVDQQQGTEPPTIGFGGGVESNAFVRSPRPLFLQNTADRRHRRSQSAAVLPSRRQQQKTPGKSTQPKGKSADRAPSIHSTQDPPTGLPM